MTSHFTGTTKTEDGVTESSVWWHLLWHVGYSRHQQQVLTLKVVFESRVTWATSLSISVFLGLSVLELGPMYATDRHHRRASLNASARH